MASVVVVFSVLLSLTASVEIIPLDRIVMRNDIECPGDIVPYNCSIESNSETIHLTWSVSVPGEMPVNITYSNATFGNITSLNSYITTSVTGFRRDQFVHSVLEVLVEPGIPTNQITLECSIGDIGNDTKSVLINISSRLIDCEKFVNESCFPLVPMIPTGFRAIEEYHDYMDTVITLDWDLPQGSGPEVIVDNYTISISSDSSYQLVSILVSSPPWNITLDHNTVYTINLTALNCAGESEPAVLSNIGFSELW